MYCFYYGAGGLITICATIYCFDNELQEQLLTAYGFLCLYCLYKVSIIYDTIYFGLGYYDFNLHITQNVKYDVVISIRVYFLNLYLNIRQ